MDSYQNCYMLCQCKTPKRKTVTNMKQNSISSTDASALSPSASDLCLCNFGLFSMSVFGFLRLPSYRFTGTSNEQEKVMFSDRQTISIDIKVIKEVNIVQQLRKCLNSFKSMSLSIFSKQHSEKYVSPSPYRF